MKLAEVHTLYETNCRDIPEMLRGWADDVESEGGDCDPTSALIAVRYTKGGQIRVYGAGDTNDIHAMGLLHLGLQEVGSIQLD